MLYYFALAENVPVERCRYELFEVLFYLLFNLENVTTMWTSTSKRG